MAISTGKIDTEYAPEILKISHLILPDIILRWPTTEMALHPYEETVDKTPVSFSDEKMSENEIGICFVCCSNQLHFDLPIVEILKGAYRGQ